MQLQNNIIRRVKDMREFRVFYVKENKTIEKEVKCNDIKKWLEENIKDYRIITIWCYE
jgi:hypothetical protein